MKKYSILFLVMMFAITAALIGCSSSEKNSNENTNEPTSEEQATNDTNEEAEEEEAPAEGAQEDVTITLASWAGDIEQERIAAFEEQFPHIKVEVDESIAWPWDEALAAAAAGGQLPDVLWLANVPPAYQHDWAADLTPFLEADPDYDSEKIFGNLAAETNYNGKQIALPHGLFVHGVLVNLDLFEKENKEVPGADWTLDEARKLARDMTKVNDGQYGFQGTSGIRDMLMAQFDSNLGWASFDGEEFHFESQAFIDSVNTVNDIVHKEKIDVESLTEEERHDEYGEGNDPWTLGKVAMKWGASWDFGGTSENGDFNWDFRPYPSVNGQRTPLVTDYIAISSTSEKQEAAFEFLKWMTYSKDGWLKRIEIEKPIGSVPLINDEDVWAAYLANEHVPEGIKNVIPTLSNGFVDPLKSQPGYEPGMKVSLWSEDSGKLNTGELRPEDIGPVWQEQANKAAAEAIEAMKK
ncbi:ABC transporter substrate-binding protein [Pseudogracilibacillus auburnensis]|uniref:ABC transporter substrate-binding protein n=1 Tax=Pseudogracilibacillus auburnensis TaxID=1494959 RepID=UPI001A9730F6|nr:extracellular solute-binding protein [Pseudogracilibacillus auburnensis]MBO1004836.1 extracellular solute-binding protein [Pseudogracilibacillus auburnensis]